MVFFLNDFYIDVSYQWENFKLKWLHLFSDYEIKFYTARTEQKKHFWGGYYVSL